MLASSEHCGQSQKVLRSSLFTPLLNPMSDQKTQEYLVLAPISFDGSFFDKGDLVAMTEEEAANIGEMYVTLAHEVMDETASVAPPEETTNPGQGQDGEGTKEKQTQEDESTAGDETPVNPGDETPGDETPTEESGADTNPGQGQDGEGTKED